MMPQAQPEFRFYQCHPWSISLFQPLRTGIISFFADVGLFRGTVFLTILGFWQAEVKNPSCFYRLPPVCAACMVSFLIPANASDAQTQIGRLGGQVNLGPGSGSDGKLLSGFAALLH
jgi:hypothetical protein